MSDNNPVTQKPCASLCGHLLILGHGRAYLCEGDGDAGIQLDVVRQLRELLLLLLQSLQQPGDLLLRQHHAAVVL